VKLGEVAGADGAGEADGPLAGGAARTGKGWRSMSGIRARAAAGRRLRPEIFKEDVAPGAEI
jgi:hypothetical protein